VLTSPKGYFVPFSTYGKLKAMQQTGGNQPHTTPTDETLRPWWPSRSPLQQRKIDGRGSSPEISPPFFGSGRNLFFPTPEILDKLN
jgi:hypothetical protein